MAIQDIGMFLPAESQYKAPGAYDEALRAEAYKRAMWLSSLDQYYEQLHESQRQFDATLKFKVETRDVETALEREKLKAQTDYWSEDIALKRETLAAETKLREEELAIQREKLQEGTSHLGYTSEDRAYDFMKDYLNKSNPEYNNPYGGHITTYSTGSSRGSDSSSSIYGSNYTYSDEEKDTMGWL